jgi:hypothetical protein
MKDWQTRWDDTIAYLNAESTGLTPKIGDHIEQIVSTPHRR